ncbi:type IV pilin protein [Thiotrichales bacterium 19S3-7]|nr:type IV pilin protein [Thiotrichales bacterium 19S3-7]MCF6801230.1 type IV pilin protein [Thiotrichales bacterium 19S3-11]
MKAHQGFTLIEIVITIVIIGIILLIAIPSYNTYIQHSRRYEATSTLEALYLLQKKYHLKYDHYATLDQIWHRKQTDNHYYRLSVSNVSTDTVTLKASAINTQKDDQEGKINCSTLVIQIDQQEVSRKPSICWDH